MNKTVPHLELVLRTPRLVLAPLVAADVDDVWPFASDPELPRMMLWEAHRERRETEAFIARTEQELAEGTSYVWTLRENGGFRGLIGLNGVSQYYGAWRVDRAELGYWVVPTHHNLGLCTEAGMAVLRFAFTHLGLHKVTVGCVSDNRASSRVMEKLGFRLVGEHPEHMFRHGRWWGYCSYEMLEREWRALAAE